MQISQINLPVSLYLPETYGYYAPSRSCTSSDYFIFEIALLYLSLSRMSYAHTFKYGSPVVGSHFGQTCLSVARIWPGVPRHWLFPSASGAISPCFTPFGGWVYCPAPEAPLIRGMPMGPQVFLAIPGACELLPCDRTHLKKTLCHIRPVVGRMINLHSPVCLSLGDLDLSLTEL